MNNDLSEIFDQWPYEPGQVNVRLIKGRDGDPRIQIRLDLGILQMYVDGRPDGLRPQGCDSLLEFFESQAHETQEDSDTPFKLSPDECAALREEAVQYYHRYMALLALEDFEGVVRDTTRNLRVLDICALYAEEEPDQAVLEQYRAYITMMKARAMASQAIKDEEPKAAILAIDEGIEALRQHFADAGEPSLFDGSNEVRMLRGMRDALIPKLPVSQKSELHQRLGNALKQENYELAAILRDELRMLRDQ